MKKLNLYSFIKSLSQGTLKEASKTFVTDFTFLLAKEYKQKKSLKKIKLSPLLLDSSINSFSSVSGKLAFNISGLYFYKYKLIGILAYSTGYMVSKNILNNTMEKMHFDYFPLDINDVYYLEKNK